MALTGNQLVGLTSDFKAGSTIQFVCDTEKVGRLDMSPLSKLYARLEARENKIHYTIYRQGEVDNEIELIPLLSNSSNSIGNALKEVARYIQELLISTQRILEQLLINEESYE